MVNRSGPAAEGSILLGRRGDAQGRGRVVPRSLGATPGRIPGPPQRNWAGRVGTLLPAGTSGDQNPSPVVKPPSEGTGADGRGMEGTEGKDIGPGKELSPRRW